MSAPVTHLADTYRIDLTREQWEALKTLVSWAQVQIAADIHESERNEPYWIERNMPEQLALCWQNIATFRDYLAGAQSLVPAVFGATLVSRRPR